jgi:alpha-L-fucosidase
MQFEPTRESIDKHEVPQWYHDAKFGIFIHWTPSCIPAFAPRDKGSIIDIIKNEGIKAAMSNQPYSEWYLNSIRIEGSPAYLHHVKTYGEGYDYYNFAEEFNKTLPQWNPEEWADLFKGIGAKYVVLVTKHHDGFLLWPSRHLNPMKPELHASRNVVAEMTEAVKSRGMKMGFYYSSPYDWTFTSEAIRDFVDGAVIVPTDPAYLKYIDNHWHELIDDYEPSLLWNDIGYPDGPDLNELFAYFYNRSPDGVVNDRWEQYPKWMRRMISLPPVRPFMNRLMANMFAKGITSSGKIHSDYVTPEYTTFNKVQEKKWELVRGMGKSFGYNREEIFEDFITIPEAIRMLIDVVSKNGNLLLNVGPMPGGRIPQIQIDILEGIGDWLEINGDAIFGTRPWARAEGSTQEGPEVRFTQKGRVLFATVMGTMAKNVLTIESIAVRSGTTIEMLGVPGLIEWIQRGKALEMKLPQTLPDQPAHVLKISPIPKA